MFTEEDIKNYKLFRHVVNSGKFEIEGKATIQVARLFDWYDKLESKIVTTETAPKKRKSRTKKV